MEQIPPPPSRAKRESLSLWHCSAQLQVGVVAALSGATWSPPILLAALVDQQQVLKQILSIRDKADRRLGKKDHYDLKFQFLRNWMEFDAWNVVEIKRFAYSQIIQLR